jgi:hypothetical protein
MQVANINIINLSQNHLVATEQNMNYSRAALNILFSGTTKPTKIFSAWKHWEYYV